MVFKTACGSSWDSWRWLKKLNLWWRAGHPPPQVGFFHKLRVVAGSSWTQRPHANHSATASPSLVVSGVPHHLFAAVYCPKLNHWDHTRVHRTAKTWDVKETWEVNCLSKLHSSFVKHKNSFTDRNSFFKGVLYMKRYNCQHAIYYRCYISATSWRKKLELCEHSQNSVQKKVKIQK